MSTTSKPVWVWLDGQSQPTLAGTFQFATTPATGRFAYDSAYLEKAGAFALDPIALPVPRHRLGHGPKVYSTQLNEGLFGVFRDACPEGYGRDLLNLKYRANQDPLSPLELLEYAAGDGVGAIEICDDLPRKQAFRAPTATRLFELLEQLPPERHSSYAVHQLVELGTSMGGERPKLTVEHDGALWLAKLQDRGDAPNMPAREHVTMRLASECGIRAAQTKFIRTKNEREVLLVRRFDREGSTGTRHAYLSAHTLLGLDIGTLPGDRRRSYLAVADRLRRLHAPDGDVQELWRRMAFNALVNNTDDHPRNHGVLRRSGQWQLAPAFDITPLLNRTRDALPLLSLSVAADGRREANPETLLASASHFGLEVGVAVSWLSQAATHVVANWQSYALDAGIDQAFCDTRLTNSFAFAISLVEQPERLAQTAAQVATPSRRRGSI